MNGGPENADVPVVTLHTRGVPTPAITRGRGGVTAQPMGVGVLQGTPTSRGVLSTRGPVSRGRGLLTPRARGVPPQLGTDLHHRPQHKRPMEIMTMKMDMALLMTNRVMIPMITAIAPQPKLVLITMIMDIDSVKRRMIPKRQRSGLTQGTRHPRRGRQRASTETSHTADTDCTV